MIPSRPDYQVDGSAWWWLVLALPLIIAFIATLVNRVNLFLPSLVAALAGLWLFIITHQSPYLLYPNVGLASSVATNQTIVVAGVSTAFFVLILLPFGFWLYRSALKG